MKFLADVNIEKPIVDYLIKTKRDVRWIPEYDCEMSDDALLALAEKEGRILVTNDKDFGELVFLQKKSSAGILLFRVKGQSAQEKVRLLKKVMKQYSNKLQNHFTIITKDKVRFTTLEGA